MLTLSTELAMHAPLTAALAQATVLVFLALLVRLVS